MERKIFIQQNVNFPIQSTKQGRWRTYFQLKARKNNSQRENQVRESGLVWFPYRSFRKSSKSKIVNCTKFSFLTDGEGIIEHISPLQQLQMCLGNFNSCQNCISFFLLAIIDFVLRSFFFWTKAHKDQALLESRKKKNNAHFSKS